MLRKLLHELVRASIPCTNGASSRQMSLEIIAQPKGLNTMDAAELQASTRQLLEEEPLLEGRDLDAKVRVLLRSEYLRRLGRYHHVDHLMAGKYGRVAKSGSCIAKRTSLARLRRQRKESGSCNLSKWLNVQIPESPEPKPLLKFLSRVEGLLDQHELL
jgi:hypothetical protein